MLRSSFSAFDPKRTLPGLKSRSAAVFLRIGVCYRLGSSTGRVGSAKPI
jgi:hypothetical protein